MARFHLPQTGLGLALLGLWSCACSQPPSQPISDGRAPEVEPEPTPVETADVDLRTLPEPASCPFAPVLDQSQSARLSLPLAVELGGAPLVIGQEATSSQGGRYRLTFYGFYVGDFELIDDKRRLHPATLVGAGDKPLSYNLLLVNPDDPGTPQPQLAVAPGVYTAVRFRVGVSQACNAPEISRRSWPLTIETEMSWGWTMLNLRLEGSRLAGKNLGGFMFHAGFPSSYRVVQVPAAVDLTAGAASRTLVMSADYTLDGDATLPVPEYVTEDMLADHLQLPQTFTLR
jgi:hypothetical protein